MMLIFHSSWRSLEKSLWRKRKITSGSKFTDARRRSSSSSSKPQFWVEGILGGETVLLKLSATFVIFCRLGGVWLLVIFSLGFLLELTFLLEFRLLWTGRLLFIFTDFGVIGSFGFRRWEDIMRERWLKWKKMIYNRLDKLKETWQFTRIQILKNLGKKFPTQPARLFTGST